MSTKTVHLPRAEEMLRMPIPAVAIHEMKRSGVDSAEVKFRSKMSSANLRALFITMGWQLPAKSSSLEKLDGELKGGTFTLKPKISDDKLANLKSRNGDVDLDLEITLGFASISGFECHRFEIEGHVGRGFRREMRFRATFPLSAKFPISELESYMLRTDNASGTLTVLYHKPKENGVLPGMEPKLPGMEESHDDGDDAEIEDVEATEEEKPGSPEIGGSSIESVTVTDGDGVLVFEGKSGDMKKAAEEIKQSADAQTGTLASTRQMGAKRGRLVETKAN